MGVCMSITPRAFAITGYWRVNVMIAYDEEFEEIANNLYSYTPQELARIIFLEVNERFYYEFDIVFGILSYVAWDSDDNPCDASEMFYEMITETGFSPGMNIGDNTCHILVGFTNQDIPQGYYGASNKDVATVLTEEWWTYTLGQCTDNILQHEISNLYSCQDHYDPDYNCVMNEYPIRLGLLDAYDQVPYAFQTTN